MSFPGMKTGAILVVGASLLLGSLSACGTPERGAGAGTADRSSVEEVLASQRPSVKSVRAAARRTSDRSKREQGAANAHADGRSVYERRCASCHALYQPSAYTDADWRRIVPVMARNAHLSAADEKRVLAYLQAGN